MPDLLLQFIRSFQKAIAEEMHAMRQRMGPFEVLLSNARALDTVQNPNGNLFFYTFEAVTQNDKLTLHRVRQVIPIARSTLSSPPNRACDFHRTRLSTKNSNNFTRLK